MVLVPLTQPSATPQDFALQMPSFDMPLTQLTPDPSLQPQSTSASFAISSTHAGTPDSTTPPTAPVDSASAAVGAPAIPTQATRPAPAQEEALTPVPSPADGQAPPSSSASGEASVASTTVDEQPATTAAPTARRPRRRRNLARAARGSGFTRIEIDGLLDLIEAIKPIGRDEWETVARRHNERNPGVDRTVESLRRKFAKLYKTNMGTGNPHMPDDVARAIQIANAITQRADLARGDDIAEDAEEIFEDEEYDADDAPVAGIARPLVAPRQNRAPHDNNGDDILSLARLMLVQEQRQREIDRQQQERWREEDRHQREQDRADDRERSNRLLELLATAFAGVAKATKPNQETN